MSNDKSDCGATYDMAAAANVLKRIHERLQPRHYDRQRNAAAEKLIEGFLAEARRIGFEITRASPREYVWTVAAGKHRAFITIDDGEIRFGEKPEASRSVDLLAYDAVLDLFVGLNSDGDARSSGGRALALALETHFGYAVDAESNPDWAKEL